MLLPPAQGLLVRTMSAAAMTGTTGAGAAVEARAPSEACLVTTAVTIAWAEALMRLHILIVENGIQMPPDVLTRRRMAIKQQAYTQMLHVVQLCFDRAFVSFNTDRVTWLKESLSAHPLREILDSVLSPPQLMPKIAVGAAAAPATATGDAPAAAATGTTATVTATGSRSTSSDKLSNSSDSTSSNAGIAAAPKLTTSSGASMSMPALPSLGATAAVAGHGDSSKTTPTVAAVASPRVGPGGVGSSTGGTSSAAAGTTAGTVVAPANSSTVPGPAPLPSPIVHAADAVIATPQKPAGPGAQTASPPQPAARTSTAALSPLATQSVLVVPPRESEEGSTPHSPRAPLSPPS